MPRHALYLISYDLEDDRERTRLASLLEGFGTRLHKSVFECRLTRSALRDLEQKLAELALQSGSVLIFRLEETFRPRSLGQNPSPPETQASPPTWIA